MKLFLDTNVILDLLENRKPWVHDVMVLFQLAMDKRVDLFVSDLTFVNISYITRKSFTHQQLYEVFSRLRKFVRVVGLGRDVIDEAIAACHVDFEDSVQYFAACRERVDYIITRNEKDFSFSEIQVFNPKDILQVIS